MKFLAINFRSSSSTRTSGCPAQCRFGKARELVGLGDGGEFDGLGGEAFKSCGREVGRRANGGAAPVDDTEAERHGSGFDELFELAEADGDVGLGIHGDDGVALFGAGGLSKLDGTAGNVERGWSFITHG